MKCPHCDVAFNAEHDGSYPSRDYLTQDVDGNWRIESCRCPTCKRAILVLVSYVESEQRGHTMEFVKSRCMVRPFGGNRPCPEEVPDAIAADFKEAALVLPLSPKSAAALGRRCLQNLIRTAAGIKKRSLDEEMQTLLDSHALPTHLAEDVDAIRNHGNFAAHPIKSTNTGEIVDVEDHEADWTLDVLEGLFDFYYVRPAVSKSKRDALNKKLTDAGKPPMKEA